MTCGVVFKLGDYKDKACYHFILIVVITWNYE